MTNLMESRAETIKLARVLYQKDASLDFLAHQPADELRAFRESVTDSLFDEHRSGFAKLARLSSLLPTGIAATLAQKALGATLAGRVTGEFTPSKAVAIARKLPPDFLARVTLNLEPRQAAPVVRAMPDDIVVAVTIQLLEREEYISMARFIDVLSDDTVAHVMEEIDNDAAMLRIGFFAENKERLDQIIRMLSTSRLRNVITAAADEDLWTEALGLASHVKPDLKGRMLDIIAEQDESLLDDLPRIVSEQGLWQGLISALPRVSESAMNRLCRLDALTTPETIKAVLMAANEQALWPELLPALEKIPKEQAEKAAIAVLDVPKKLLKTMLMAARDQDLTAPLINFTARLTADTQSRLARRSSDLLAARDRRAVLEMVRNNDDLKAFCEALEQSE